MFYDPIPIYIYSQGCADDEEEIGAVSGLRGGHQGAEVHAGARTEAAQVEVSRGLREISQCLSAPLLPPVTSHSTMETSPEQAFEASPFQSD